MASARGTQPGRQAARPYEGAHPGFSVVKVSSVYSMYRPFLNLQRERTGQGPGTERWVKDGTLDMYLSWQGRQSVRCWPPHCTSTDSQPPLKLKLGTPGRAPPPRTCCPGSGGWAR